MKIVAVKNKRDVGAIFSTIAFSIYNVNVKLRAVKTDLDTKFLISIPNSKLPRAVDRNRVKRIIRDIIRKYDFKTGYDVALIYNSNVVLDYTTLEASVLFLVGKLK